MRVFFNVLLGLVMVAYPFLVFWGLTRFQPRVLALMIGALFFLRWLLLGKGNKAAIKSILPLAGAAMLTVGLVLIFGDGRLLLLNPVFMNAVFFVTFAITLKKPPSMIERFARIREPDLPQEAIGYCRKVTLVWCAFFIFNGSVALWTATMASVEIWTLYNGLISYFLMGALFAVEFLVRRVHMRAHAAEKNGKTLA